MCADLRDGAHHSGNWGGLLRNPATVLAAALATIVDGRGRILVPDLRPAGFPPTSYPDSPVNAIPGTAHAHCQLRSVVGTDLDRLAETLRKHLDASGFGMVEVTVGASMRPTRTDPDDEWVRWALGSISRTTGGKPALLPNLGGSIPNEARGYLLFGWCSLC